METRKNIRLRDYDYSQPGYHYITICTCDRQPLFDSWVGAHLCVRPERTPDDPIGSWLFELERKFPGTEIDTYCVMPDHIHVILVLTGAHAGAPLPEIIKWYKTQTNNAYIRMVRCGECPPFHNHVWQRGYYEHVIRHDEELMEVRDYILQNPLKLTTETEETPNG